jgi:hypothetical protein
MERFRGSVVWRFRGLAVQGSKVQGFGGSKVQGSMVQGSAPPPAKKTADLIEKETPA